MTKETLTQVIEKLETLIGFQEEYGPEPDPDKIGLLIDKIKVEDAMENVKMDNLQAVKMKTPFIIDLIIKVRSFNDHGAWYTTHPLSNAVPGGATACSDKEICEFVYDLLAKKPEAKLIIGSMEWEQTGNCVGDELYHSSIMATKLPGSGRYFLELKYWDQGENKFKDKEYVWNIEK